MLPFCIACGWTVACPPCPCHPIVACLAGLLPTRALCPSCSQTPCLITFNLPPTTFPSIPRTLSQLPCLLPPCTLPCLGFPDMQTYLVLVGTGWGWDFGVGRFPQACAPPSPPLPFACHTPPPTPDLWTVVNFPPFPAPHAHPRFPGLYPSYFPVIETSPDIAMPQTFAGLVCASAQQFPGLGLVDLTVPITMPGGLFRTLHLWETFPASYLGGRDSLKPQCAPSPSSCASYPSTQTDSLEFGALRPPPSSPVDSHSQHHTCSIPDPLFWAT